MKTLTFRNGKILMGGVATLLFSGCLFSGDKGNRGKPIDSSPCVDISSAILGRADSLVDLANMKMTDNFAFWIDTAKTQIQRQSHDALAAIALYDQALAIAPGHCQAVFGRSVAQTSLVMQDKKMDDFIKHVEALDSSKASMLPISTSALFKTSPDQSAPKLLKLTATMDEVNPVTVTEVQDLIESSIMPRLDSIIQVLETVMNFNNFAIRYRTRDRIDDFGNPISADTIELDHSEVGPVLAALKVGKAYLTVIAGYNWEIAISGKYDWMDTLGNIENFRTLSSNQTQALDHLTGLFKPTSTFSRYRTNWSTRVQAIPTLLVSALNDVQNGLKATIEESKISGSQIYDPWIAGDGQTSDVDTVDLRVAIEAMERMKKYMQGVVPISYKKGVHTIRVNFLRFFAIDGIQGVFPYFRFLPYAEWGDTASVDTTWDGGNMTVTVVLKGPIEFTNSLGTPTFKSTDFNSIDSMPQLTDKVIFRDPTFNGVFPDMTNQNFWLTLQTLNGVNNRVLCNEDPDTYRCHWLLPSNPSDLDYLVYTLNWLDEIL